MNLVKKLGGTGSHGNGASRILLLDNCAFALMVHLSNRKPHIDVLLFLHEVLEPAVVPSRHVSRAFDQMTSDESTGELIELICFPVMPPPDPLPSVFIL